jgi:tetratricopeptide (TPR) repeat protein
VRITAQLIRAENGFHLWSETWDRTLDDIFAVQDEIAAVVTEQLKLSLLGHPPVAIETNPEAYALYLQARHLTRQGTSGGYQQARALLRQALDIAADYAPAWRQLGTVYLTEADRGLRPADEGFALGQEATEKALSIDPNNALAHANLGRIALSRDQDLATAARHMQKALVLAPGDSTILAAAANLAVSLGRIDTAIALDEYVAARDPVQPSIHESLGANYLIAGRADDAVSCYRTALHLSPEGLGLHANLGLALLARGDAPQALEEIARESFEPFRLIAQAMAYHDNNQQAESDAALAEVIEKYGSEWASNIASVLAYTGQADQAFQWLEKAMAYHDPGLPEIDTQPEFTRLHGDPRWEAFLARIGKAPEQLAAIQFEVALPD